MDRASFVVVMALVAVVDVVDVVDNSYLNLREIDRRLRQRN